MLSLNTKVSREIKWNVNFYLAKKIIQTNLMKNQKRFKNTFDFCNNNINKFILLLRKGIYPYKYIDKWEKFNETSSPEKEEFYSNLNIQDITGSDYTMQKESVMILK